MCFVKKKAFFNCNQSFRAFETFFASVFVHLVHAVCCPLAGKEHTGELFGCIYHKKGIGAYVNNV